MDTGFEAWHLYSACKLTMNYLYTHGQQRSDGFGTGFIVQFPPGDPRLGLVTNRHLVDIPWKMPSRDGTTLESIHVEMWPYDSLRVEFTIQNPQILLHNDKSIDVSVIPFGTDKPLELTGYPYDRLDKIFKEEDPSRIKFTFEHAMPWTYLLECEQLWPVLRPGEMVVFPGYPIWYDRLETRPIFRSGVIASDPQRDYRKYTGQTTNKDGNQQLLFDAFSTNGNSGSPVFVAQRGIAPFNLKLKPQNGGPASEVGTLLQFSQYHRSFLIGINAGHFNDTESDKPQDHAGLSRMHKLSAILDILRSHTRPSEEAPNMQIRISADLVDALGGLPEGHRIAEGANTRPPETGNAP